MISIVHHLVIFKGLLSTGLLPEEIVLSWIDNISNPSYSRYMNSRCNTNDLISLNRTTQLETVVEPFLQNKGYHGTVSSASEV